MESPITANHFNDANGNPGGGITYGHGFTIAWQNGPLRLGATDPVTNDYRRNGAFVEDIIKAAADRIAYYQNSRFACQENADAYEYLTQALGVLNERTSRRTAAGVEGTHKGN